MGVFEYAAKEERYFEILAAVSGYERKTTFYSDLSIGEYLEGECGVKDTYERVMESWLGDIEYMTEFVLSLNWKCWEHYEKGNEGISALYSDLYKKAYQEVVDHYTENGDTESLHYFFEKLD